MIGTKKGLADVVSSAAPQRLYRTERYHIATCPLRRVVVNDSVAHFLSIDNSCVALVYQRGDTR